MTLGDILSPTKETALARYTRNLTEEARAGRLDPVRCRAPEIDRVVDVLLRHGKNNPVLVGAAGVGKTAIVEGLAQRVADGNMPLALRDVRIHSLDHVALVAGTVYRGQYEERLNGIIRDVTSAPDVILFVDELHNLVGGGMAQGVAMDAGNMLKPALVRGDFRVIGATTNDEYERWICADPALERRFQKVDVRELDPEETREILRARRPVLERHHGVLVADDALEASLLLTDKWVTDRMRPDRAIDALDEACAHAQARASHGPRTIALLEERRAVLAGREFVAADAKAADSVPNAEATPTSKIDEESLKKMAREGIAAIERFGAGIESFFNGGEEPMAQPIPRTPLRPRSAGKPGENGLPPRASRLGVIEAELAPLLAAEGAVVRGVDVAKVVARAVGTNVRWP